MKFWKPLPYRQGSTYLREHKLSLRTKMYMIAFIICLVCMNPLVVHADILGYRIMDVYAEITANVKETNEILTSAYDFAKLSPYEIVNSLFYSHSPQEGVLRKVHDASQTAGLAVATLLLLVDFFRKSVNFEWSSKWENILLFLIKILVMKQVVQNADVIISSLYALFNFINDAVLGAVHEIDFLPAGRTVVYTWVDVTGEFTQALTKGWWNYWADKASGSSTYQYEISKDAVQMFYPYAEFPDGYDNKADFIAGGNEIIRSYNMIGMDDLKNPTTMANFMPTLKMLLIQPYFWILKACAYLVYVITIGRVFELCLYTLFAPLPLATFASDTTHDVAKNFLKNYIAVVLQVSVIVAMFSAYVAIVHFLNMMIRGSTGLAFLRVVALLALGSGVLKSSAWSKKICGIG